MPNMCYSKEELLSIGTLCYHRPVALNVYQTLKQYGICSAKPTRRGHRTFVKDQHSISTVQPVPRQSALPRNIDTGNLIFINCTSRSKPVTKQNSGHLRANSHLPSTLLLNARSLCNKIEDLQATIHTNHKDVHLIAVTETWFSAEKPATAYPLPGYHQFHHDRANRIGGGVALYVRDDLNATLCMFESNIPQNIEIIWVKLKSSVSLTLKDDILVCVTYCPPRSPHQDELSTYIIDIVDTVRVQFDNISLLIMGDFNDLDTKPIELHTSLQQIINMPTRGSAILDKFFTNVGSSFCDPVICAPLGKSDHCIISLKPQNDYNQQKTVSQCTSRPFRDSSVRCFGQWITHTDWSEMNELPDASVKADWFQQIITDQYRYHFKEITTIHRLSDKAWMNNRIRRLIVTRDAQFKRGDICAYKKSRNLIQREILRAKKSFYEHKIQHLKHTEPGKWHQQIRSLTGMHKSSPFRLNTQKSSLDTAHELNCHFARICNELPSLDLCALPSYLPALPPPIIARQEVYNKLRKLNATKSGHPTDVPIRLLKEFAYEISEPLTTIFNECLRGGHFPSNWKTASVCHRF